MTNYKTGPEKVIDEPRAFVVPESKEVVKGIGVYVKRTQTLT